MAGTLNTGNKTVDAIGQMNLTGNVTPPNWYKTVLRENGKPYLLAICILSEICYWYRPREVRDEQTGSVVEYRKRFRDDLLQKSYQQLADQFGESKRAVKAAMDCLEQIGVITRVWRNKTFSNGVSLTNILYIDLNEEKLYELTFGTRAVNNIDDTNPDNEELMEKSAINPVNKHVTKKCNMVLQNNVGGGTKKCTILLQNNAGGGTENCNIHLQNNVGGHTGDCDTYTESISETISETTLDITNENTTRDDCPISSDRIACVLGDNSFEKADMMDKMRMARSQIKKNIQYDALVRKYPRSETRISELVEIMVELIAVGKAVNIRGTEYPYSVVIERFEKYDYDIMAYVIESLESCKTKPGNMKQYLISTLFNAPSTADNYYNLDANSFMEQMRWGL